MYLKSAFNYTGAKYPILEQIFTHFPNDVEIFYDVFCGGGSVFINSNYQNIVANDVIKPLIDFYKELKVNDWETILTNLKPFILDKSDKEAYSKSRSLFNANQTPYHFFSLIQSCTNNMMRFNKKFEFNQTWGNRGFGKKTEEKLFAYWEKLKDKNVEFYNINYIDLLPIILEDKRKSFVYLDPPYFGTLSGYNTYWSKELEEKIYYFLDILNKNNIKFALSGVSIHKDKKNPFFDRLTDYKIINIEHDYDKVSKKQIGITQEILVINY